MTTAPYLAMARLIDCQSYSDITYEFSPGLNILNGTNQIGKSTFYKMLSATVSNKAYSRDEWKDLISYNKESAKFLLLFSDGSISLLIVTKKGPRYFYKEDGRDPNAQYIESPGPWEVVREKLGVIVDDETGIILNIVDQDNISRMTLNTSTSPNIINRVSTHEGLENLLHTLSLSKEEIEDKNAEIKILIGEQKYIMSNNKMVDTETIKRNLDMIEPLLHVQGKILNLVKSVGMMKRVSPSFNPKLMIKALSVLEVLMNIEDFVRTKKIINEYGGKIESLRKVGDLLERLEKIQHVNDNELVLSSTYQKVLSLIDTTSRISVVDMDTFHGQKREVEALVKVDNLLNVWDKVLSTIRQKRVLSESINETKGEISLVGREVECPIYGRIQHDGGICVPLDNRPSLEG